MLDASSTISWTPTLLRRKVAKRTRWATSREKAEVMTIPSTIGVILMTWSSYRYSGSSRRHGSLTPAGAETSKRERTSSVPSRNLRHRFARKNWCSSTIDPALSVSLVASWTRAMKRKRRGDRQVVTQGSELLGVSVFRKLSFPFVFSKLLLAIKCQAIGEVLFDWFMYF